MEEALPRRQFLMTESADVGEKDTHGLNGENYFIVQCLQLEGLKRLEESVKAPQHPLRCLFNAR